MITIFAVPKPFDDSHIAMIQKSAIRSWLALPQPCEVLLLGDERGVADIAQEFGIQHIPDVAQNEFGTPLLNSVFDVAQANSKYNILVYVNADIILMSDFIAAVRQIHSEKSFLLVGRRYNLDINAPLDFTCDDWEVKLRAMVARNGRLFSHLAIDYFVFPRGFWGELPPFILGRRSFDNWLLYRSRSLGAQLIDASKVITVVHQNHHYNHLSRGQYDVFHSPEGIANLKLTGGPAHLFNIRNANKILTAQGIQKAPFTLEPWRRFLAVAYEEYPQWRLLAKVAGIILSPSRIVRKIRRILKIGISPDDPWI